MQLCADGHVAADKKYPSGPPIHTMSKCFQQSFWLLWWEEEGCSTLILVEALQNLLAIKRRIPSTKVNG